MRKNSTPTMNERLYEARGKKQERKFSICEVTAEQIVNKI